jgi:hypothetical protein
VYDKSFQYGCISNNRVTVDDRVTHQKHIAVNWGLHEEWLINFEVAMMAHCCITLKDGGTTCVKMRICKRAETLLSMAAFCSMFEQCEYINHRAPAAYMIIVCTKMKASEKERIRLFRHFLNLAHAPLNEMYACLAEAPRGPENHMKHILEEVETMRDRFWQARMHKQSLFLWGLMEYVYTKGNNEKFTKDFYTEADGLKYRRRVQSKWENLRMPDERMTLLRALYRNEYLFGDFWKFDRRHHK